jgi:ParB family chromosome partitioning protein
MSLQQKRTGFGQRTNNLPSLSTKELAFKSGAKVTATRIVIKANEIEDKTVIHHLNIRNQTNLTAESLRDILPSIRASGVHTEGFAIESDGKFSILESSRRRMACVLSNQDLPLYVFKADEISDDDLTAFIESTFTQKKLSYREIGAVYPALMEKNNWSAIQLAEQLNIGRETCRKRLVAASINQNLIDVFPDPEGIPNSFYSKLVKVEKYLNTNNISISKFIKQLSLLDIDSSEIDDIQQLVMRIMLESIQTKKVSRWLINDIKIFSEKDKYAKIHETDDNKKLTIELSGLNDGLYKEVIKFVNDKINHES